MTCFKEQFTQTAAHRTLLSEVCFSEMVVPAVLSLDFVSQNEK